MPSIELTPNIISSLKHINTNGLKSGFYEFPDFMILGPQRTGTTWLQRYLIQHPDVFMPHLKELYFFNYLIHKNTKGVNFKTDRLEWYSTEFNLTFIKYLQKNWSLLKSFRTFKKLDYDLSNFFKPVVKGEATVGEFSIRELGTLARQPPAVARAPPHTGYGSFIPQIFLPIVASHAMNSPR